MSALVILVNTDRRTLNLTEAILTEAGHLVAPVSSFSQARDLLKSTIPDLLVADVQLDAFNGLHLAIRCRYAYPSVPVIITHARTDAVVEAEARRHGAEFVSAPLENPEFLQRVQRAITARRNAAQQPIRRWSRLPIAGGVGGGVRVTAAGTVAQVLDLSYGGIRLAFADQADIPTNFEITLPSADIVAPAHRVWTRSSSGDNRLWCGAEFEDLAAPLWRGFVDSVKSGAYQSASS